MSLVGSGRPEPKNRVQPLLLAQAESSRQSEIERTLDEGKGLFAQAQYTAASEKFRAAFNLATAANNLRLIARALGNLGGCQFALHRNEDALHSFLEAHKIAERAGDKSAEAALEANISSLYSSLGELDAAVKWKERALHAIGNKDAQAHLAEIQIELAALRAWQGQMPDAMALFRQGIDGAQRANNYNLVAAGWNRLGEELLRVKKVDGAERAFLEAYRIRRIHHLPVENSYSYLGRVRLLQGDSESAAWLLDRAVAFAASGRGAMLAWRAYDLRGRARMAQGQLKDALEDFRVAVRLANAWRWSGNDATRSAAQNIVDPVHAALIDAGNRLYLKTGDPALIAETFEAAEENRDSSLRALLNSSGAMASNLPPPYWEAVARLQRAEVAALGRRPGAEEAVRSARAEIVRIEADFLPDAPAPYRAALLGAQRALPADSALLSYHLGESVSWLWALDREGLALYALPSQAQLERQVRDTVAAIRDELPNRAAVSAQLYASLFGRLPPRFTVRRRWMLAFEGELLHAPVAALLDGPSPAARYVAERHIISVIPGAAHWLESAARPEPRLTPVFLGIGDPIYNTADPRIAEARRAPDVLGTSPMALQAAGSESPRLQLPRLVASGQEIDACVRAWRGPHVLLKGADASRRNVVEQLRRGPAVVHFATHVLQSRGRTDYGVIVLGLGERGETEVLSPLEIARWRIRAGVVVLSGCQSATDSSTTPGATGAYGAQPGAGLMGLTRAWLAAGAQSIVASRWTMPDVDGALFTAFYKQLSSKTIDAAEGLRAAQLQMLQSGGWRAQPKYWGAYFVVGNR